MAIELRLKPVERVVFRSDVAAIAQFRCPVEHPLFRDSGPCSNHTFAFPRTVTAIIRADKRRFIGSPNVVSCYNENDLYRREAVSAVDASDWYVVAGDVLIDAISTFDPVVRDRPNQPFTFAYAPIDTRVYLAQRRLFERVASGRQNAADVEETVLDLLSRVLQSAYRRKPRLSPRMRDAVVEAQRAIGRAPQQNLSLRELAASSGTSPFQLCRAFAELSGTTLTAFRNQLRVRLALGRLRNRRSDLTDLALSLGFSSHSHFTAVFRRQTGMTPSAYRSELSRVTLR